MLRDEYVSAAQIVTLMQAGSAYPAAASRVEIRASSDSRIRTADS